jgi:hypothetical protein
MKTKRDIVPLATVLIAAASCSLWADQPSTVILAVNVVDHGSSVADATTPASKGTSVHDGEYLKTGGQSRAELLLPSTSVTRLGAYTIFNYSAASNTVDLQAGTILFCKPKRSDQELFIKAAAVTAGITGTTGFVSIQGEGKRKTYILGLIEGHAIAHADDHPFPLGPGDVLEFRPGGKAFTFAFDVPRFVKSTTLIKSFHSTLPNQSAIDAELESYADDVSRGFIVAPSKSIDYSGDIPLLSTPAYDSAQNSQDVRSKAGPEPSTERTSPSNLYNSNPNSSSYH